VRRFVALKPKLREIEAYPILHEGQPMVMLRDPLRLSDVQIAIPRPLGNLLALMDGTRDEAALEAALQVRAGVRLAPGLLSRLLADLDEACLLDNERFAEAKAAALQAYRRAPFRPLTLDGVSLPADPEQASAHLQAYVEVLSDAGSPAGGTPVEGGIRGVISPHIDYRRGGLVYAEVWQAAAQAAREAELIILFGTDHQGGNGTLTLTRQSYATPWGTLPTDLEVVDALATSLGEEAAFAEELHHRGEHSIELAAVWLHFIREGRAVPLVPILCGSFGGFVEGQGDPATHGAFAASLDVLREVMAGRQTLVVAAADLAHMGPAFGDLYGLDYIGRAQLRNADHRLLQTVYDGDPAAFFEMLKAEGDRRNVCGLPPIYLTLRLLGEATGKPAGYDICPADPQGTSFVSIAGVILR
jgi:AmmeMemoRadiSam system protein B